VLRLRSFRARLCEGNAGPIQVKEPAEYPI